MKLNNNIILNIIINHIGGILFFIIISFDYVLYACTYILLYCSNGSSRETHLISYVNIRYM